MTALLRFAPSPNGRLHLGHAFSALVNQQLAEKLGGHVLLRLEDIDVTRCTPALAQACLDDLRWLGVTWQGSVRVQSQHFADYAKALDLLKQRELVYPCFCTRKEVAATSAVTDPDGAPIYPGTCRALSAAEVQQKLAEHTPHSWRLDMEKVLSQMTARLSYRSFSADDFSQTTCEATPARWGDVILARKETPTSYHLSVVVDDALQNITHVVRGQDLQASTCVHALLQALLELPQPLYHHHALITFPGGEKMSKSKHATTLAELREQGMTAAEVRTLIGF